MDKQYKEWLQEQTFETLAADNYNTKLLLLAEQVKNKKLVEALEKIGNKKEVNGCTCFYESEDGFSDCNNCDVNRGCAYYLAQQALNEVNYAK